MTDEQHNSLEQAIRTAYEGGNYRNGEYDNSRISSDIGFLICAYDAAKSIIATMKAQNLERELSAWLDKKTITQDNIGQIRRQCFVPWSSSWNALVRDETAKRETSIE